MSAVAYKSRGVDKDKETDKAARTDKIKVCFTKSCPTPPGFEPQIINGNFSLNCAGTTSEPIRQRPRKNL